MTTLGKPVRRFKTVADARRALASIGYVKFFDENPSKYPCLECRGVGVIYDPDDPPDVIEGNKLRNRIKCPKCKGTRCGTREEIVEVYRQDKADYLARKAKYDKLAKAFRSAVEKLSQDEIDAIKAFGL